MLVLNFLGRIILPELVESKDITLNLEIILNFTSTDKVQKCNCHWIGFPSGKTLSIPVRTGIIILIFDNIQSEGNHLPSACFII